MKKGSREKMLVLGGVIFGTVLLECRNVGMIFLLPTTSRPDDLLQKTEDLAPPAFEFFDHWDTSEMSSGTRQNISVVVELTGELGNHLHHIASGRSIQTMLWKYHQIPSHLIFRRHSNEEKYKRTQRQLTKCFPHLRNMEIHGPRGSSLPSQKSLEKLQKSVLGQDMGESLLLQSGSGYRRIQDAVGSLNSILGAKGCWKNNGTNHEVACGSPSLVSMPFIRTSAMINRETMDAHYSDFRGFFEFDEKECCALNNTLQPREVAIFHFRNFLGELKKGKSMGMEELSSRKVATEVFGKKSPSNSTSVAIATRFPGRKAANEYADALSREGLNAMWLTTKASNSSSPPSAMQDFCAMMRTKELVGMVRSTFVVWAALLGATDALARLYSVDSKSTREKFKKTGKPIFRTYNWTHPDLKRRIHFELYQAEDVEYS